MSFRFLQLAVSAAALSVLASGGVAGAIRQTFDTAPGQHYEVLVDMAGNPYGGDNTLIKTLEVSLFGATTMYGSPSDYPALAQFTFDVSGQSGTDLGWTGKSLQFLADDSSTVLRFRSLTTSNGVSGLPWYGPTLDNVRVNPVPAPATLPLLATAFGVAIGWRRSGKKSAPDENGDKS